MGVTQLQGSNLRLKFKMIMNNKFIWGVTYDHH